MGKKSIDLFNLSADDKLFLKELTENRNRTVYIELIPLNSNNEPLEDKMILGYPTGGSINIDGASAVRRSCNLTLIASNNYVINDYDWAFKTRFTVKLGLENNINKLYEDIIWFPQGVFVITSFNASLGTNNYSVSVSGQDKMCLLNGEVGGTLTAQTDFAKYDEYDTYGNITTHDLTIAEIIKNIITAYARETDYTGIKLPTDKGYNLLEYRGQEPLYLLLQDIDNDGKYKIENATIYGNQTGKNSKDEEVQIKNLSSYWKPGNILLEEIPETGELFSGYQVQKIEYGAIAGYEQTALAFAGDLIANVGETVTSVLDKIKNMLGDYEYFYDINGLFRFQKKRTFLQTNWNGNSSYESAEENGEDEENEYSYNFNDLSLFSSFANNPNLKNLKNDFTVWGTRKSITGNELPIHMRVAIDEKPVEYENIEGTKFTIENYDWRELIYQMALDQQNRQITNAEPQTLTGYEQYYTDFLGFWRQLYYPGVKSNYVSAPYNSNETLYFHAWKSKTVDDNVHWRDWYQKVEDEDYYYISWIDLIDLSDSSIDLNSLYIYDRMLDEYRPLLDGSTINSNNCYYFIDNTENKEYHTLDLYPHFFNLDNFDIEKLRYKRLTGTEVRPLVQRKRLQDLPAEVTPDTKQIFLNKGAVMVGQQDIGTVEEVLITEVRLESPTNANIIINDDNYNTIKAATAIYYSKDEEWIQLKNQDTLYLYQISYVDNPADYTIQYENEGVYINFATFLKNQNLLNESSLYLKEEEGVYKSLIQYISISKGELYIKTTTTEGEGDNVIEISTYSLLGDTLSTTLDPSDIYIIDSNFSASESGRPQFETYYKTDWKGQLVKDIEYKRFIPYYKLTSDYYGRIEMEDENGNKKTDTSKSYWNRAVFENPETLLFWFDFIDTAPFIKQNGVTVENFEDLTLYKQDDGENKEFILATEFEENTDYYIKNDLARYSRKEIGNRNMAKNESTVKAIYYPPEPAAYYGTLNFNLPETMKEYFAISARGQSAHDAIDTLLYNHTYITESISINSVPIYHLDPNTKIKVIDEEHGINGDYIVDKLTIPLTYNGMMSISATKAPKKQ